MLKCFLVFTDFNLSDVMGKNELRFKVFFAIIDLVKLVVKLLGAMWFLKHLHYVSSISNSTAFIAVLDVVKEYFKLL